MSDAIEPPELLIEGLQMRIAGLHDVLDVTRELAAEKDLDSLLDLIIRRTCHALRCERVSLFLYDDERQELYTRSVTKLDEGVEGIRLSIDKGIAGLVARERRIELVSDPYSHPEFNPVFDRQAGFHTRNILAAPLVTWGKEDKLLGVLQLLNKLEGGFDDGDADLVRAFAAHAAIAVDRAILTRHYEEKTRLLVELNLAKQIQADLLPQTLPDIPGYEIAAISRSADATGGDYYDVIPHDSGETGLVVADVSGHGVGPSLLMASARAVLRGIARRETAPEELLSEMSAAMFTDLNRVRKFITLLYGKLDHQNHIFHYANAGHGPVVLHMQAGRREVRSLVEDKARGFPLGWFDETYTACEPVSLAPGDLLIIGTDGLVEARRDGEQFGVQRLSDLIVNSSHLALREMLEAAVNATISYNESDDLDDDLTILAVRRLPDHG